MPTSLTPAFGRMPQLAPDKDLLTYRLCFCCRDAVGWRRYGRNMSWLGCTDVASIPQDEGGMALQELFGAAQAERARIADLTKEV